MKYAICDLENLNFLARQYDKPITAWEIAKHLRADSFDHLVAVASDIAPHWQALADFAAAGWSLVKIPNKRRATQNGYNSNADVTIGLIAGTLLAKAETKAITLVTCDFALILDIATYARGFGDKAPKIGVLAYPKFKNRLLPNDIEGVTYERLDRLGSPAISAR